MGPDEHDDDTPMRTDDTSSSSGSSSTSDSEDEQVEWLVTSRAKRATAGNRLTSLLQQEEGAGEDELELLFAEADDDAGFEDDLDAESDVQMDSSSDDEDQGPVAAQDDLEGEKELRQQERAEKAAASAKKRKAHDAIPKIFKKRVKIDPTLPPTASSSTTQEPAPRPKKKSERASWIPTLEDMPTRASSRGTTRQSKEQLHAQMIDREVKRLRQLANMEKAAAAKEAAKKPALTQADRLAEAARVEKANSKSLTRWEEAEQAREEEQRARLAALGERKMEGPVITWWSGRGEWFGGVLKQVGRKKVKVEEKGEKVGRKRKAAEMEGGDEGEKGGDGGERKEGEGGENVAEKRDDDGERKEGEHGEKVAEKRDDDGERKEGDHGEKVAEKEVKEGGAGEKMDVDNDESAKTGDKSIEQPVSGTDHQNKTNGAGTPEQENTPETSQTELATIPEPENKSEHVEGTGAEKEDGKDVAEDKSLLESEAGPDNKPEHSDPSESKAEDTNPPETTNSPPPQPTQTADTPATEPPAEPPIAPAASLPASKSPSHPPFILAPPPGFPPAPAMLDGSTPLPGLGFTPTIPPVGPPQFNALSLTPQNQLNQHAPPPPEGQAHQPEAQALQPTEPPAPPVTEHAALNYLILANFDENAIKNKDVQTQILFGRKFVKLPSKFNSIHSLPASSISLTLSCSPYLLLVILTKRHPEHKSTPTLCAITSYPAKYRDPSTGLPYCNPYAYREIQRLKRGEYRWSKLIGAYVGLGNFAARGVPSRFLAGGEKESVEGEKVEGKTA